MGSTRPTDRSIGEATFLPQWMKGKSEARFDLTDSAFSPPADDTFFFIHYPKPAPSTDTTNKEGFRSLSDFLAGKREPAPDTSTATNTTAAAAAATSSTYQQKFTPLSEKVNEPKLIIANKPKIVKPLSADDELSTDKAAAAAERGRSIVHVASQIMFGKSPNSNAPNSPVMAAGAQPPDSDSPAQQQQKDQTKKVSKSLPATPLTSPSGTPDSSPRARRRAYGNRFFTGAFVQPDGERQKNGWLLSSILGQSRELVTPKIDEEDELPHTPEQVPARALSRKKSISSQNLTYLGKEDKSGTVNILQAQPSELREMNFWSPTSM